jgi:hypothetical protein
MAQDTSPEVIRNLLNSEAATVVDVAEELSSTQRKRMYVTFENPTHANAAFEVSFLCHPPTCARKKCVTKRMHFNYQSNSFRQ